jgi:hypothetical protein
MISDDSTALRPDISPGKEPTSVSAYSVGFGFVGFEIFQLRFARLL